MAGFGEVSLKSPSLFFGSDPARPLAKRGCIAGVRFLWAGAC